MRMWMIDPKIMCKQHLMGEHLELHMLYGCIEKNKNVWGFIEGGLMEYKSLKSRHDALAAEMGLRGYNHKTPMDTLDKFSPSIHLLNSKVDRKASQIELFHRCERCRRNYEKLQADSEKGKQDG